MTAVPSTSLGDVCSFLSGGTPSRNVSAYFEGDVPWITGADITGPLVTSARDFISEAAISGSATTLVPSGTVLLVTRTSVGKVARAGMPLCFSQDITALVPSEQKLDAGYLVQFLRSKQTHLKRGARGATIKGIARSDIESLRVPLLPLAQQRRIAAILDQAETLRVQRRATLEKLGRLREAMFLEMFAGAGMANWRSRSVSELVSEPHHIRTGPFGSQLLHSEFVTQGVAVLGIDNAVDNEFKWGERRFISPTKYQKLRRYAVHGRDVLITIMGTCGKCAIVPDDVGLAINTKHLCCITLDRNVCLPEYLQAWFLYHPEARRYLERTAKGAIMSGLNMGIIKSMPVAVPPVDLQREFTERVVEVQNLMAQLSTSAVELDALFASLQHRAFSGQL